MWWRSSPAPVREVGGNGVLCSGKKNGCAGNSCTAVFLLHCPVSASEIVEEDVLRRNAETVEQIQH